MQETEYINVYGARVHNLKDIDAEIPRNSNINFNAFESAITAKNLTRGLKKYFANDHPSICLRPYCLKF